MASVSECKFHIAFASYRRNYYLKPIVGILHLLYLLLVSPEIKHISICYLWKAAASFPNTHTASPIVYSKDGKYLRQDKHNAFSQVSIRGGDEQNTISFPSWFLQAICITAPFLTCLKLGCLQYRPWPKRVQNNVDTPDVIPILAFLPKKQCAQWQIFTNWNPSSKGSHMIAQQEFSMNWLVD